MSFQYYLLDPNTIVLDASATALWLAGTQDEIKAAAQKRADGNGHTCAVFASNAVDILYQCRPTPPAAAPTQQTVFGGVASWLARNLNDPDEG